MSEIEKMRLIGALRHATGRATIETMTLDDWQEALRLATGLQRLIQRRVEQARDAKYQAWRRRPRDNA